MQMLSPVLCSKTAQGFTLHKSSHYLSARGVYFDAIEPISIFLLLLSFLVRFMVGEFKPFQTRKFVKQSHLCFTISLISLITHQYFLWFANRILISSLPSQVCVCSYRLGERVLLHFANMKYIFELFVLTKLMSVVLSTLPALKRLQGS